MGILLNKSKNYVINGGMDFFQRGSSFVAVANNQYIADRFRYEKIGTMVHTASQSVDVPSFAQSGVVFASSLRLNLTTPQASLTTNQRCRVQTRIEGQIFAPLKLKPMVLTFWVKATLAGIYSVTFGDSGSSVTYVKDYTVDASNTWEKKSIALTHSEVIGTWNYTTSVGLGVTFCLASGPDEKTATQDTWLIGDFKSSTFSVNGVQAGATDFYLTGVQLEEGTTSSNFDRTGGNTINELRLCQRYFEKSYDLDVVPGTITTAGEIHSYKSSASSSARGYTSFKVTKRTTSAIIAYSPVTGTTNTVRVDGADVTAAYANIGMNGYTQDRTGGSDVNQSINRWHFAADAEL